MTFKLSEKGKRKFRDNFYWFAEEFEQDDFEDVVCLSVEEAKEIANFFGAVDACTDLKLTKEEQKAWNKLTKRIEQAEGKL